MLDRSALSPSETNALSPIPRRDMPSIAAAPNAPLWETKPTVPAGTSARANVAGQRQSGRVLTTPMQFGPTSRIPVARQTSSSSASRAAPSAPGLGEPGGDDHERGDARLGALARHAGHGLGGHGHDREVDRPRRLLHRRPTRAASR